MLATSAIDNQRRRSFEPRARRRAARIGVALGGTKPQVGQCPDAVPTTNARQTRQRNRACGGPTRIGPRPKLGAWFIASFGRARPRSGAPRCARRIALAQQQYSRVVADRDEWMRRLGPVYPGLVALARTTALVPSETPRATEADVGRAAAWVVAVGALIGVAGFLAVELFVKIGATRALAALVGVVAISLIGGGVAERGLARWMRKVRLGEGVTVAASALLRWVALVSIEPSRWAPVLLVAPVVGRWAAVFLQALADPAPFDRSGRSLVVGQPAPPITVALSAGVCVAAVLGLGWIGIGALAVAAAGAFAIGLRAQRQAGGIDAEVVGAAAVIAELVVWVAAALAFPTAISPWQR